MPLLLPSMCPFHYLNGNVIRLPLNGMADSGFFYSRQDCVSDDGGQRGQQAASVPTAVRDNGRFKNTRG
jgi:hypothetical protein